VGEHKAQSGVSFGPEWKTNETWIRMADLARDYRAIPEVEFVHPLLVKFRLLYTYVTGMGGPYFSQDFVVTPDGILTRLQCLQKTPFALTIPLLENDGRPLNTQLTQHIASTSYSPQGDEQNFISLNKNTTIDDQSPSIQSTYGWLKPVRFQSPENSNDVFIYPRNAADPTAENFLDSFQWLENGFSSVLGSVKDKLYVGRTSAGGLGKAIDLDGDGKADVQFDQECNFILQLDRGKVKAAEADRRAEMQYRGNKYLLQPFFPISIE
jgi:hypothetical protein